MLKKIQEYQERLPDQHKDLAKYTLHLVEAIDKLNEEHRRLVAVNAVAGIKPNPAEETSFQEHLSELKHIIFQELEKTVEDIEHKGDKNWHLHFKDGVDR
ncbi:hypothetical protein [Bacillus sp. MUM 13]|uniref:hypothetical protein n=1 Tax=Bacillus sp. MUM 13 TaxID=1678001 RepID=UPI0008F5F3BA|nr:hypothetical protein [Bacillus sp. MUM 13]OIK10997.1 hypothetical protein BIV59_13325 [Bacillus sp. MUM 13]